MSYLDLAATLIQRLEALRLTGYPDSGGKPTNGWGHTGPEVKIGVTIILEVAEHNLSVDLALADKRLSEVVSAGRLAALDDHERAALLSFVFNVGAGDSWQIWKDLNAGNNADVPTQLRRFVNGEVNGKEQEIPGLANRREAEIAFWNTADVEAAAAIVASAPVAAPPSSTTRDIPTPPTPTPPEPLAKASLTTKVVTAVAAVGASAQQIHDIVAPHVDEAKIFQTASVGLIGVVIVASVIALLIHGQQQAARKT